MKRSIVILAATGTLALTSAAQDPGTEQPPAGQEQESERPKVLDRIGAE